MIICMPRPTHGPIRKIAKFTAIWLVRYTTNLHKFLLYCCQPIRKNLLSPKCKVVSWKLVVEGASTGASCVPCQEIGRRTVVSFTAGIPHRVLVGRSEPFPRHGSQELSAAETRVAPPVLIPENVPPHLWLFLLLWLGFLYWLVLGDLHRAHDRLGRCLWRGRRGLLLLLLIVSLICHGVRRWLLLLDLLLSIALLLILISRGRRCGRVGVEPLLRRLLLLQILLLQILLLLLLCVHLLRMWVRKSRSSAK